MNEMLHYNRNVEFIVLLCSLSHLSVFLPLVFRSKLLHPVLFGNQLRCVTVIIIDLLIIQCSYSRKLWGFCKLLSSCSSVCGHESVRLWTNIEHNQHNDIKISNTVKHLRVSNQTTIQMNMNWIWDTNTVKFSSYVLFYIKTSHDFLSVQHTEVAEGLADRELRNKSHLSKPKA